MLWKTKAQAAVFLMVAVVAVSHAKAWSTDITCQKCKLLIAVY